MKTGCKRWSDCFTCPFSDCMWGDESELRKFSYYREYAQKNKSKIKEYKKKYYEDHKDEIKAKKKARETKEKEVPV